MNSIERGPSLSDLEIAKQQIQSIAENFMHLVNLDPEHNRQYNELQSEIRKIQRQQDLIVGYGHIRDMMEDISQQASESISKEDLEKIKELQRQLLSIMTRK